MGQKVHGVGISDAEAQRVFADGQRQLKSREGVIASARRDGEIAGGFPELVARGFAVVDPSKRDHWNEWTTNVAKDEGAPGAIAYNVAPVRAAVELMEEMAKGAPITEDTLKRILGNLSGVLISHAVGNAIYLSPNGEELKKPVVAEFLGIPLEKLNGAGEQEKD